MKRNRVLYARYPLTSVLIYNGITILHFVLGGIGLILGYLHWWGYLLGSIYIVFAFAEMYLLMPIKVCPNCPYSKLEKSLCISGLNGLSRKFVKGGNIKDFQHRAKGMFCPNNLYLASLAIPVLALIPAVVINFSYALLAIWLVVIGLLAFRFFFLFPKIACGYCKAKNICPNAKAMGLGSN